MPSPPGTWSSGRGPPRRAPGYGGAFELPSLRLVAASADQVCLTRRNRLAASGLRLELPPPER